MNDSDVLFVPLSLCTVYTILCYLTQYQSPIVTLSVYSAEWHESMFIFYSKLTKHSDVHLRKITVHVHTCITTFRVGASVHT